jgi:phage terminase large subunit-like protein
MQFELSKRTAIIKQMAKATTRLKRDQNIADYYPNELSYRQRVFVELDDTEAFYGGAAGGGKSDALLAAALEFVHVPRYRAIIFRRTSPRLQELIDRSREWLEGKAEFNEQKLRWTFPSGAWLHFGHMQHEADKYNFKTFEFQFIGWDELTEFLESQYTYMFSRLRAGECALHRDGPKDGCQTCQRVRLLSQVPRRVRSSSNPEGEGRDWVKARFVSDEAADAIFSGEYRDVYHNEIEKDGRRVQIPFVPSRAEDNPGIVAEKYFEESLSNLAPVERARLKAGDWKIRENGVINVKWLRYYDMQGQILRMYDADGNLLCTCDERDCRRFTTIDTAGTSEDVAKERRGKPPSWSVAATWDKLPNKFGNKLLLRNVWRKRVGLTDLLAGINGVYADWKPKKVRIEDKHFGPGIADMLRKKMPITTIAAGSKDKLERATDFLNMLERGEVFLPKYDNDWRPTLEAEWLSWQGHPDETADQIDVASYAAWESKEGGSSWGGPVVMSGGGKRIGAF